MTSLYDGGVVNIDKSSSIHISKAPVLLLCDFNVKDLHKLLFVKLSNSPHGERFAKCFVRYHLLPH